MMTVAYIITSIMILLCIISVLGWPVLAILSLIFRAPVFTATGKVKAVVSAAIAYFIVDQIWQYFGLGQLPGILIILGIAWPPFFTLVLRSEKVNEHGKLTALTSAGGALVYGLVYLTIHDTLRII